jgi:hypothetical protein
VKPNDPYHWTLTLSCASASDTRQATGDIEEMLQAVDEAESDVDFEVTKYVIERGAPVAQ